MIDFAKQICSAFCDELQVHPVPAGYAVSTAFEDASGDKITFYVVEDSDGFRLEDDGDYLATLIARDMPFEQGARGKLLDAILAEGHAYWDRDSYEIRTASFSGHTLAARSIAFLSALIRVRDLMFLSRERVRSAFKDDVVAALERRFGDRVDIEEGIAPRPELKDFPADLVLRPKAGFGKTVSVYLAATSDKLNEALVAWLDHGTRYPDLGMVAVLEDANLGGVSRLRYQRAANRRLPMAIFRGDEEGAVQRIESEMQMAVQ
jgi:hypothetical protein